MQRTLFLLSFLAYAAVLLSVSWLDDQRRRLFRKESQPLTPLKPRPVMPSPKPQPQDRGQDRNVPDFIDPEGLTDEELDLIILMDSLESSYDAPSAVKPSPQL